MVVKGKIYPQGDFSGLADATIKEVGSSNMAKTDASGNFTLLLLNPVAMIEISKNGYKTQKMLASAFSSFVTLEADFDQTIDLNPVTIIDDQSNNTWLYVGIGAAAAAALYFATRKKPQRVKVY